MAQFRLDSIAELARQMAFTPLETRAAQVAAAEELLHAIDPGKAYPLAFVIYRITGYHPRHSATDLLTGLALQNDLGLLIEQVSQTLELKSEAISEPVLKIEDVCERFNVTSKTVQRWRRRGLAARRFVFPDGKRRVGFLLRSVERFFASHRDQAAEANCSKIEDVERDRIVFAARRLAIDCRCWAEQITRRLGRRMNRSPLAILHILRKHDQEHPREAILPHAPLPPSSRERAIVAKGFERGLGLARLARRLGRTRSAVYAMLMDERIRRLTRRRVRFIDDPLYHQSDAASILTALVAQDPLPDEAVIEEARIPRDLPPYLQELYRVPLLGAARERALFLKFNFHKYQFVSLRRQLEPELARRDDLDRLEEHLRAATETKNTIVRANLRLVVSIARKHLRPGLSLMELVSEGNWTLMRAAESFDPHRGHRFSTYATLALMKGFARGVPEMLAGRAVGGEENALADVPDWRGSTAGDRLVARDEVRRLLSQLDERERDVVAAHYGLADQLGAASYEQVGRRLGISKERVRQIEQRALAKLRAAAHLSQS